MQRTELTPDDQKLIEVATEAIRKQYDKDHHHIGCAVRLSSGEIYVAVSMNTPNIKRAGICADPIAISQAIGRLEEIDVIVSVRSPQATAEGQSNVVNTCGICREFLAEYVPNAKVILRDGQNIFKINVFDLLPFRFTKDTMAREDGA